MATFGTSPLYRVEFVNHSNTEINFDLRDISGDPGNFGNVAPGATATSHDWRPPVTDIERGNVAVVGIGQFGQPQLVPAPGVRFWSGESSHGIGTDQYINLLEGNGWKVTRNTSLISEVTGNGFRVTVDGGGSQPETNGIYFQVYNV